MRGAVALCVFVLGLGGGCSSPPSPSSPSSPSPPTPSTTPSKAVARPGIPPRYDLATGVAVVLTPQGERRFKVELAVQEHERQRGLMYREALAEDEGMLFLFEEMGPLSFWMKNTWIPLDMLFIDDDLTVVGVVENAEPMTTTPRSPGRHARFVLEVRGGLSQQLGMAAGQRVRFEGVPESLWQKQVQTP
jgi:uncharacterized membrane protein (UPF0127 family)